MIRVNFAIQKDSGIYKRILFDCDDVTGFNFSASIYDPEISPRVEMAAPTIALTTEGTDKILTVSLDPALLSVTLGTGETRKVLAWEGLLDPALGYEILIASGDVVYTLGGSA